MSKLTCFPLLYPATHLLYPALYLCPLTHQMCVWSQDLLTYCFIYMECSFPGTYMPGSLSSYKYQIKWSCLYAKHTLSRMIYMETFKGSANISWTQILILLFTCVKARKYKESNVSLPLSITFRKLATVSSSCLLKVCAKCLKN